MEKRNNLLSLVTLLLLLGSGCNPDPCTVDPESEECRLSKIGDDDPVVVEPEPEPEPDPTPDPGDPVPTDFLWQEVAGDMINHVEPHFNDNELTKIRTADNQFAVDKCHESLSGNNRFADVIGYYVEELSNDQKVQLQSIASYYGMQSNDSNYYPVSLLSHPLCRVTSSTLSSTVRNVPGSSTIALAQRFADDHNRLRQNALGGSVEDKKSFLNLWGKFFGCLAYTESLTTADTSSSRSVASQFSPAGYSKPNGVKFYDDPAQSQASRLNIGMFQFTPTYSGNINACIKQWNRDYPSCAISGRSQADMIRTVGSSLQHFNAYCGVHKVLQTFSVQVNSSKTKNTHPDNYSGGMKSSNKRCVTPHFYAGWAYNHFGPLQNSTGSNLNKLLKCVYRN